LTRKKPVPDMTYNVSGGTLNLALSIYPSMYYDVGHQVVRTVI